jgi:hypothetical protein
MPSKNKTIQFVDRVKMSEDFLSFDFNKDFKSFTIEIAGPAQFYNSQKIKTNHTFSLESVGLDEHPFIDGLYTVQITANFELSVEEQEMLRYLTATNESEKLKAEKAFLNIVEVE